jgi:hypothetical protein
MLLLLVLLLMGPAATDVKKRSTASSKYLLGPYIIGLDEAHQKHD